jgi:hypothetical protein
MADLWYYTNDGKQMEPVPTAELKRLAASGKLKPRDMVWKEGMPDWVRAISAPELLFDNGLITAEPVDILPNQIDVPDVSREEHGDRPRRARRRDTVEFDDHEYRSSRRRRRRAAETAGMSPGLKAGLIMGGTFFGLLLIGALIFVEHAREEQNAFFRPAIQFNNPPPAFIPPPAFAVNNQPPAFQGPLDVGPAGFTFTGELTITDPRDVVRNTPCKVFAVNMVAGKSYTIRHNRLNNNTHLDPFLRLEDSNFAQLAQDDDSGGFQNALLVFSPAQTNVYRVIATTFNNVPGPFSLQITEK